MGLWESATPSGRLFSLRSRRWSGFAAFEYSYSQVNIPKDEPESQNQIIRT
jgi:hypothetical protein